jgi:hypothetical protein
MQTKIPEVLPESVYYPIWVAQHQKGIRVIMRMMKLDPDDMFEFQDIAMQIYEQCPQEVMFFEN